MLREEFLDVQIRDREIRVRDLKQIPKRLIENDLSTIRWMFQAFLLDVSSNSSRDLRSTDEFAFGETQELLHLGAHLEGLVEAVVNLALLALLPGRVVDVRLNASDELREELQIGSHRGDFIFNVEGLLFSGHGARCVLPRSCFFKP